MMSSKSLAFVGSRRKESVLNVANEILDHQQETKERANEKALFPSSIRTSALAKTAA